MNLHPKVLSGGAAASASVVLLFILGAFGVTIPQEVAAAITGLLSVLAGYIAPAPPVT